ncbi:MAG TPA: hypothetical protein PK668_27695 [Myxococcota bacterium]|nr:hypothetical protein [Myxococcota bacterium]HRY95453.1 hypothetical protein [Myxococcota bacterium]
MPQSFACSTHPHARAAWVCSKCGKSLCPDCGARQVIQQGSLVRCVPCGGVAEPIRMRKEVLPYWGMLHVFLLNMLTLKGLVQLAVVGGVLAILRWVASLPNVIFILPLLVTLVYLAVWASFYFMVVRRAARGQEDLPEPEDFLSPGEVAGSGLRFIAATALLWVPACVYIYFTHGLLHYLNVPVLDPVLILILLVSVVYFPGAMIVAAISGDTGAMLNPLNVLGVITRIPGQYFLSVLVWGVITVLAFVLNSFLLLLLTKLRVPVLGGWLYQVLSMVPHLLAAFVLGRLIYQNGETLEYISARDLLVEAWPGAKPVHEYDEAAYQPARSAATEQPVEPIPLDEEGDSPDSSQAALARAVESGAALAVLECYQALVAAGLTPTLEPRLELRLAACLDRAEQPLDAAHACRRAAEKEPRGPFAARAVFTAAKLLVDRVGQREQGIAMYRYLVANFPKDELALRATELLRRLGA